MILLIERSVLGDVQVGRSSNFTLAKIYLFPVENTPLFSPAEGKHGHPPSILLQLATDASLQSANPNCT